MNLLLRRKRTQRDLGRRPGREREQSLAGDVLKPVEILRQHVVQEVLDFPVGPLDQDEAAIAGLGRTLKEDCSQRPRRIVGQMLTKPSRLASSAEVEALALRTQFYKVLLAHTLDRFGHLLGHESRLAINGQTRGAADTGHAPTMPQAHTVTVSTLWRQYSRQLNTRVHQYHRRSRQDVCVDACVGAY